MGIDTDLIAILHDLVQFLETLSGVDLPNDLRNVCDNLLRRSRTSLVAVGQRPTTPEPYLDMNAGKGKGLHLIKTIDVNNIDNPITEYMYADNSNQSRLSSCQDYYEPFLANITLNSGGNTIKRECNDIDEELKSIYRTFSSEQTISKATKSGPLNMKEERRLFGFQLFSGFDLFRSCFIGLVGTHLLLYATKHDKHPSDIISIRGYSARASPNAIPRDLERSKSAFEMFSPGSRTFQFTARSPKEMEQWVAVICRAGNAVSVPAKAQSLVTDPIIISDTRTKSIISDDTTCSEEQYQDVGCVNNETQRSNLITDTNNINENDVILRTDQKLMSSTSTDRLAGPPPLPARIPRRLPSLPHEHQSPNLDSIDDGYDEDDIYYRIEDVKQPMSTYQNLSTGANHMSNINDARRESEQKEEKMKIKKKSSRQISLPTVEIYDDAKPVEILKANQSQSERMSMTYDDIQTIVDDARKEIVKETRKKSFLDRVRYNKKESPKKEDSKKKSKHNNKLNSNTNMIQLECGTSQELSSYDDVLGLGFEIKPNNDSDMGDYTCPPAPRSIYIKPSTIIVSDAHDENEDFYDDIGVFQNKRDEKCLNHSSQVSTVESSRSMNDENSSRLEMNLLQIATTTTTTNAQDECEHYQVPRSQDPIDIGGQVDFTAPIAEELYDDIAIVANFRARQRDSGCSNSLLNDKMQSSTNNVVKVWNRFASGRKMKTNEQFNNDECVDSAAFNSNEEIDGLKINKFQKLINKMESSLSKSKPIPAINNQNS